MDCDHAELNGFVFCSRPSTFTDSIMTIGGWELGLSSAGFTDTKPLVVGKNNFPSCARIAAGCEPAVHSRVGRPSVSVNVRQEMALVGLAAKSFNDFFEIRIRPMLEPIHKSPA